MTTSASPLKFRVVSYNVLSSALSRSSYFIFCSEAHCAPKHRLEKLLTKLEEEVSKGSIVCLQEVSLAWTGRLHAFFSSRKYTFVNSNYGNRDNNFMGVGVAFPTSRFTIVHADLAVISDTKPFGWNPPRQPAEADAKSTAMTTTATTSVWSSWAGSVMSWLRALFRRRVSALAAGNPELEESLNSWSLVKSRFNVMVSLQLRPVAAKDDALDVLVSTYHVPCVFWNPGAMTICCALAAQRAQALSEGRLPYILAGDFNVKPNSPAYSLMTTGNLPVRVDDPADAKVHGKLGFPTVPCFEGDKWNVKALPRGPMRSAYLDKQGKEPPFTNFAKTVGMDDVFSCTIDYIFFGSGAKFKGKVPELKVLDVTSLDETCVEIATNSASLPNGEQPSDHLLIGADFELALTEVVKAGRTEEL